MDGATYKTDVLIIGSGGAGLRAAIEAAKSRVSVLLVSKGPIGLANTTAVAGGGITAALGDTDPRDSPESHARDTISGSRYLCNPNLVKIFTEEAPDRVRELEKYGVPFERQNGKFIQYPMPGHTYARDCQIAYPNRTGSWIPPGSGGIMMNKAMRQVAQSAGVKFLENILIFELIRETNVKGALGINLKDGKLQAFEARATILATGGAGQIYLRNAVPKGITGDGFSIGLHTGTELIDMEFVQFYAPTIIQTGVPQWRLPYHYLLEMGAVFLDEQGQNALHKYGYTSTNKVTRDIIARLCGLHGSLKLDMRGVTQEQWENKVLHSTKTELLKYHIDPQKDLLNVSYTGYHFMGGIRINGKCETGLQGLYAAGEVTGGIHGANRLGSNAFPEMLVFGARAGHYAAEYAKTTRTDHPTPNLVEKQSKIQEYLSRAAQEDAHPEKIRQNIQTTVWKHLGPVRTKTGVETVISELKDIRENKMPVTFAKTTHELQLAIENQFLLDVSELVAKSALLRTESRGAHYRLDYPKEDSKWMKNIVASANDEGTIRLLTEDSLAISESET
jgi:fumarate reductase (CoM/CoB) subunit A